MSELPPELKTRVLRQVEISTSVHNWLQIADILEEHADNELREDTSTAKPGWEFGRQMSEQIRLRIADELGG